MRVLLVDDHQIMREGLSSLLRREPNINVVGEAADGSAAVEAVAKHVPDVVVMDLTMPGLNGIEATRAILRDRPQVRVLCLSMHADHHMVSAVLKAGAAGYMLKDSCAEELVRAIRVVAANGTYLSPAIAGGVVRDYLHHLSAADRIDDPHLTSRERQVLQLIAEGHSTKAIAVRLRISTKTVATHREHIKDKLGLDSTAALTKYAIRRGITSVERT